MRAQVELSTELLILQPTPFCNVDCRYCYLPGRDDRRRMEPAVLEAVFSKVLPSPLARDQLTVVWHAGEPLVLPPSWYETAFAIAERHRPPELFLQHNFQTNGTLIDAGWVKFFRQTGAKVGLSIDGPAAIHDRHRRTRSGGGTHAAAVRGLRFLQDAGYRPHVITVLTADSLDQADALFEFYRNEGIDDVSFNVEEVEAAHRTSSLMADDAQGRFRGFLQRFLELMRADPGRLALREARNATSVLRAGALPDGANQESEPLRIISVDVEGNISSFSPELLGTHDARYGAFTFGNIQQHSLEGIVASVLGSDLYRDIRDGVGACERDCMWSDYCRGGSPGNKLFELGRFDVSETMCCRLTRKTVLDVVLGLLEAEVSGTNGSRV